MQEFFFSIGFQSLHLSPKMNISCGMPLQVHMEQRMIHALQALVPLQADTSYIAHFIRLFSVTCWGFKNK